MGSMSRRNQNNISLPETVVFNIIGEKRLQNELLASYLTKNTGQKCTVHKKINDLPVHHREQRFVILDCQSIDIDHMMMELKSYNARRKKNNHIVLFNVPEKCSFQRKLIMQGVHGFFYDHDTADNLIKGILTVIKGRLWLSREMMSRCILEEAASERPAQNVVNKLTPRQVEILSMIAVGASNQEISEKLFVSPHTVKNHLYNIFKKIKVSNRIQASLWAAVHL